MDDKIFEGLTLCQVHVDQNVALNFIQPYLGKDISKRSVIAGQSHGELTQRPSRDQHNQESLPKDEGYMKTNLGKKLEKTLNFPGFCFNASIGSKSNFLSLNSKKRRGK